MTIDTRNASKVVSGTNAVNDLVGFWLLHSKATIVLSDWGPYVPPQYYSEGG